MSKFDMSITISMCFMLMLGLYSCSDGENTTPTMIPMEEDGLCKDYNDTMFVDGVDTVWVPGFFTPNNDGEDDKWYPRRSNDSIIIAYLTVITPNDLNMAETMYSSQRLYYRQDSVEGAWDGSNYDTFYDYPFDYEGPFQYSFRWYASSGNTVHCRGWACADRTPK